MPKPNPTWISHVKDAAILISVCVGLVALGVMPKCSDLQTVQAAEKEHGRIHSDIGELKTMVRRIHDHLIPSRRTGE